jgi:hypothetical protein
VERRRARKEQGELLAWIKSINLYFVLYPNHIITIYYQGFVLQSMPLPERPLLLVPATCFLQHYYQTPQFTFAPLHLHPRNQKGPNPTPHRLISAHKYLASLQNILPCSLFRSSSKNLISIQN